MLPVPSTSAADGAGIAGNHNVNRVTDVGQRSKRLKTVKQHEGRIGHNDTGLRSQEEAV